MDPFCYLCFVFVFVILPWLFPAACDHMLEKGCPLGSHVYDVSLCFCQLPIWCPGSGVVLYCIDSCSLPSSKLCSCIMYHCQTIGI